MVSIVETVKVKENEMLRGWAHHSPTWRTWPNRGVATEAL